MATATIQSERRQVSRNLKQNIRTMFQLAAEIDFTSKGCDDTFYTAMRICLNWLSQKFNLIPLPKDANQGRGFNCGAPGHKVECISILDVGIWSLRYEHPDTTVPGRVWTTDIALTKRQDCIAVGVRLFCAYPVGTPSEVFFSRPNVVLDLARVLTLRECTRLTNSPIIPTDRKDLERLKELLVDPRRTLPVIILSQPNKKLHSVPLLDYVLDGHDLARKTYGFAHVVQLSWDLGFEWTSLVSKPWSTFLGSARVYMPELDFRNDSLYMHPLTSVDQILFSRRGDEIGEKAFSSNLVSQLAAFAASKRQEWGDRLFIADARSKAAELASKLFSEDLKKYQSHEQEASALRKRLEELEVVRANQVSALQGKIEELYEECQEYCDDSMKASKDRDYYIDQNQKLRVQLTALRNNLESKSKQTIDSTISIPDSFEDMEKWVDKHLAGRLELHPRAIQSLKNAQYEEPTRVYNSLLLLANEYRDSKLSICEYSKFVAKAESLHLHCSKSISDSRRGEFEKDYEVHYPVGTSTKRELELHLRSNGNSRDAKRCLAIYFFWDEETQQVIVGYLPGHLDNRMT